MRIKMLMVWCAVAGATFASGQAHAQKDERAGSGAMVSTELLAKLTAGGQTRTVNGQLNGELSFTEAELKAGVLQAPQLNVALFGVDQYAITGRTPRGPATAPLGVVRATDSALQLRYDDRSAIAEGELAVQLTLPQYDEIFGEQKLPNDKEGDAFTTRLQTGKLLIKIAFDQPLSKALPNEQDRRIASVSASLRADAMLDAAGTQVVKPYRVDFELSATRFEIYKRINFEIAKSLCIQPVRVRSSAFDLSPTGAGLAFGMPGAKKEWGKADVVFVVRDFITVTSSALKVLSESESSSLRSLVNADDCIEVFFVQNLSPESMWGGGATWGSGTASAKVISSDGNATFGVDLTHLAHELGHVLNMGHPGAAGSLYNASTGTLMCPSGWHNDNPKRNSTANKNNVANPLLKFSIKAIGPGTDCANSASCGACP